jgi:hypothetical protein
MRGGRHAAVLVTAALAFSGCTLGDRDVNCGAHGQTVGCQLEAGANRHGVGTEVSSPVPAGDGTIVFFPPIGLPPTGDRDAQQVRDVRLLPHSDDRVFGELPSIKRRLG